MKKSWVGLEGSFLLLLVSTAVAHEGGPGSGGLAGLCAEPGVCHSVVDAFGHGLFGTGWIGFIIIFGIWLVGLYALLSYILRNLEIEIREYEIEDDDDEGFKLLSR